MMKHLATQMSFHIWSNLFRNRLYLKNSDSIGMKLQQHQLHDMNFDTDAERLGQLQSSS